MRIPKEAIPVRIDVPGAVARQLTDFGEASDLVIGAEYFSLGAGTDLGPLLVGLHDDACHSPHWGHLLSGQVVVTYTDGQEETCFAGDVFYWPPGHSVRADKDSELVLFSPQVAHGEVMDHVQAKLAAAV